MKSIKSTGKVTVFCTFCYQTALGRCIKQNFLVLSIFSKFLKLDGKFDLTYVVNTLFEIHMITHALLFIYIRSPCKIGVFVRNFSY